MMALNAFRLQIFRRATVSSRRESNSDRRSGRDTDKTVLSRLARRCELALTDDGADKSYRLDAVYCYRFCPPTSPLDTAVSAAETVEPIETPFRLWSSWVASKQPTSVRWLADTTRRRDRPVDCDSGQRRCSAELQCRLINDANSLLSSYSRSFVS